MARGNRSSEVAAAPGVPRRLFTPLKVGAVLGVIVLGSAALLSPTLRGDRDAAGPRVVAGMLPPPAPGTPVPLNDTDLFTGKPTASGPMIEYKGYMIGFCCPNCEGYRGGWARMPEWDKDAIVRGYIQK